MFAALYESRALAGVMAVGSDRDICMFVTLYGTVRVHDML